MTEPARTRRLSTSTNGLHHTLRTSGIYGNDPTHRRGPQSFAKAVTTPAGPGTVRLRWDTAGEVSAEAWGSGADWLLDHAPHWLGTGDDPAGFDPALHPRVAAWARRHGTPRLGATHLVWPELLPVLVGQRVTAASAANSWRQICHAWGERAPGPCDLLLAPTPAAISRLSYVDLHRLSVERRRADAILLAAKRAHRLEEAASMNAADAVGRLSAIPGLGLWTATATVLGSHGDADTILLRDYELPTVVNYAFTGDAQRLPPDDGGDEIMVAHLAPWRGHRQRVIRLIRAAGVSVPRRAPRAVNPDIRRL